MVVKPLGLPRGSVRAVLLLALVVTAILDVRNTGEIQTWLVAAAVIAAVSYFSSRSTTNAFRAGADGAIAKRGHPLGLPAGSVRTVFLLAVAYGAWLWLGSAEHPALAPADHALVWVVGAFALGVLSRWVLRRLRRPDDPGARFLDHLLGLISLVAGLGLVAIAAWGGADADVPSWGEPLLAAVVVHYFGTR